MEGRGERGRRERDEEWEGRGEREREGEKEMKSGGDGGEKGRVRGGGETCYTCTLFPYTMCVYLSSCLCTSSLGIT